MTTYQPTCPDCGAVGPEYELKCNAATSATMHRCEDRCAHCNWARVQPHCRGLCTRCHQSPGIRANYPIKIHRAADLIEDVEWLLDDDATLTSATARLGIKADSLWRALKRHGRLDLYDRLADREPNGQMRQRVRMAARQRQEAS